MPKGRISTVVEIGQLRLALSTAAEADAHYDPQIQLATAFQGLLRAGSPAAVMLPTSPPGSPPPAIPPAPLPPWPAGTRVDLFWAGGLRRNVAWGAIVDGVATIADGEGLSQGDLPPANTVVSVGLPVTRALFLPGDKLQAAAVDCDVRADFCFVDAEQRILFAPRLPWHWPRGDDPNPLAGRTVAGIRYSPGDHFANGLLRIGLLFDF